MTILFIVAGDDATMLPIIYALGKRDVPYMFNMRRSYIYTFKHNPFIFNDSICYEVMQRRVYHATHFYAGPCSRFCGYVSSLSAFNIHKNKINKKKNPDGVLDFSVFTVCSLAQTKSVPTFTLNAGPHADRSS